MDAEQRQTLADKIAAFRLVYAVAELTGTSVEQTFNAMHRAVEVLSDKDLLAPNPGGPAP